MKTIQLKMETFKIRLIVLFIVLFASSSSVFAAAYKVTGVNVTSQSATLTYGTSASTTYTITLSESGNGSPSGATSFLSIAWSALPTGVTVSGLGTIALTGNGQTVQFTVTTTTATPAGTSTFTISATNNNFTSGNVNFVVYAKALTITANNISKVYGTTQSTSVTGSSSFTTSGLANGDTIGSVTLTISGGALSATSAVGSTCSITPSSATGGSFTASNYSITYSNGTLTVTAAPLTITANNGSKTYGQTYTVGSGSTAFTFSGLKNSETIGSITLASTGAVNTAAVGSYSIVPSAASGGSFTASNYSISYTNGTLTVNTASLTITASNGSKNYGQTYTVGSGSTAFTSSGLQNSQSIGSITLASTGAVNTAAVGSYNIVPSAATGGTFTASNYSITYTNGTLTVGTAALTITANTATHVYGATLTPGAGVAPLSVTGMQNSETLAGTVTLAFTSGNSATSVVGTYTGAVSPSAFVKTTGTATLSNYTISYVTNNLSVTAATLTITANNGSKTYGQTFTTGAGSANFTSSGLLNSETIGSITIASTGAVNTAAVGSYSIVPSAATGGSFTASNYSITYTNGTLTVGTAALTVTANTATHVYGATLTPGAGAAPLSVTGMQNSETLAGTVTLAFTSGNSATSAVGTYTGAVSPSAFVKTTGTATLSNYTISYVTNNLIVTAAILTITANNGSKTYGQTFTTGAGSANFTSSGLLNSETIGSITLASTGAVNTAAVGSYSIVPSAATGGSFIASNYSITYTNGILTVNTDTPTVTLTVGSYTYSGTAQGPTVAINTGTGTSYTFSYSGTGVTTYGPSATLPTNAGSYTAIATVAANGNYASASSSATAFTIGVATPTVTVTVGTYTYSGSPQGPTAATNTGTGTSYTFSYSGTSGTTYGPSATLPTNAGTYAVIATIDADGNYESNSSTATNFSILQKAITIVATDVEKNFGEYYTIGTTAFTIVGIVNNETIGGVTLTSDGATAEAQVGTYPIVPSDAVGGTFNETNYNITYTNGTLTVNPVSDGGSISGESTVCAGTGATLTLSNQTGSVVRWEYTTSPYTNWITISNTSTANSTQALTETTRFRAAVQYGSNPIAYSSEFEVAIGITTTWNGTTWDNGNPDSLKSAVIAGNYTSNGASLSACSLTINNNATVIFNADDSVSLSGALTVATGCLVTFESNANLIQSGATNLNSGNVIIKRNSSALKRQDYALWSSPVASQQLLAYSPQTLTNRFYTYNTSTNLYDLVVSPSTTNFETAKGYLIRMPNNHPTTATTWTGQFAGVPNNGYYSFPLVDGGTGNRFNLVGNPYPSPIDLTAFINNATNSNSITGTLYFWRKTNAATTPTYCIWNLGGYVGNGDLQAFDPNDVLQTGQGFFVEGTGAGSTVVFDNSMRTNNHADQFFKSASTVERNRIWLNATNTDGLFSQTMVGYVTNATQNYDPLYDGKYINTGDISLTSLIGTTPFAIQSRALPFADTDLVPLSFKATNGGNYTISLDHVDGLFSGSQGIYLRDNLIGTIHDLNSGAYNFISEAGNFDSRFELVYQSSTLGITPTEFNESHVILYKDLTNNLIINTGTETMASVRVFDLNGKLLVDKKDINSNHEAMNIRIANEVVVVQIISNKGITVTKKFLVQRVSSKEEKFKMVKVQVAEDE